MGAVSVAAIAPPPIFQFYGKTKKQARALLDEQIRQSLCKPVEISEMSFKQFVDDVWWPHLRRKEVKRRRLKGYECNVRNHIMPFFSDMRLAEIRPIHVEKWLQGRTALSPKSEINIGLLQNMFAFAVDNDMISANPVRKRHKPKRRRTERPAWSSALSSGFHNKRTAEAHDVSKCKVGC